MAILSSPGAPTERARAGRKSRPASSASSSLLSGVLNMPLADFYIIIGSAALLIGLGIMMVLSASSVTAYTKYGGDSYYFVKRQALFAGVGLVAAVVVVWLGVRRLRALAWPALGLAALLVMATYVVGTSVNGNQNWIVIGGFSLQPSELAKLAMILWGADILARKEKVLDQTAHLLVPFLPLTGLMVALVVFQGDMGTAVIMAGILAGILFTVGTPWRVLGAIALVGLTGVAIMTMSSANRMRRLLAFLNPSHDQLGANMQATVGVYALATGGWWGVGLGASRQKWGALPEAHTDYIFAVIGEELGLVGSLVVLFLFFVLGFAGYRVALRSDELFCRLAAAGVTTWFMFQAMVNLGVVLRLLPVMGVPLPMVSYGGSALLANMMALGLLVACAHHEPEARALVGARRRTPQPKMTTVVGSRRGSTHA
ncbi:putative lipid II flippase FtsW [Mariniluteicoccus endophyticus]